MKPSSIILDLLRTFPDRGASAKLILSTGKMFGISDNTIRVNISRLTSKGVIDKLDRGHYRISQQAAPLNDFVEEWRLGEKRRKKWKTNNWLCLMTDNNLSVECQRGVGYIGFRKIQSGLWVRPDNLRLDSTDILERLRSIGIASNVMLLAAGQFAEDNAQQWFSFFDIDQLNQQYADMNQQLHNSLDNLANLSNVAAKKETFLIGGAAIQMLIKDPLIPDQIQAPRMREALWQTMLEYDKCGRAIWAVKLQNAPSIIPTSNVFAFNGDSRTPLIGLSL
jgi:phenylacetic acid degradation operon negative regulatory protein